jgi:exopolysaccharide biosynthesis protein
LHRAAAIFLIVAAGLSSAVSAIADNANSAAAVRAGEIQLRGVVSGPDPVGAQFSMQVRQVQVFRCPVTTLSPARNKIVKSGPGVALRHGDSILAIGPNSGAGQPLAARLIVNLRQPPSPIAYEAPIAADGETAVDGRLDGPLASDSPKLTILVEMLERPDASRTWLAAIQSKLVTTNPSTQYYIDGRLTRNIYYADDGRSFFHVRAIGIDYGVSRPLIARVVMLTRETETQRFLFEHTPAGPASASADTGALDPQVEAGSQTVELDGRPVSVSVVSARLTSVAVRCGIARRRVGSTESLGSIAHRYGAIAAINGSYFDAYNSGSIKMPDMLLISRGILMNPSTIGTLLGFTGDGRWRMDAASNVVRLCGPDSRMESGDDPSTVLFWSHVTEAIGCGPRLVVDGVPSLNPFAEGFHDREALSPHVVRSAVGVTGDGRILFVVIHHSSLESLARVMVGLGCRQAMNLDGGASSGLWFRGRNIVAPGRQISNAILITPRF